MTFNYDEEDDFEEADDLEAIDEYNEADDFEPEPEDDFLEEDEPNTALSRAFRDAAASDIEDDEDDDDDDDLDDADDDESADEQLPIEPIDPLPDGDDTDDETDADDEDDDETDEDDVDNEEDSDDDVDNEEDSDIEDEDELEVELPTLELPPPRPVVEHFRPREQSNTAYADAVTAYYVERNYRRAIEKFDEALAYEAQHTEDNATDPNEIVAKSKYWQAEAYAKLQDLSQAIGIFEDLIKTCQGHYLVLAAERRAGQLNLEDA